MCDYSICSGVENSPLAVCRSRQLFSWSFGTLTGPGWGSQPLTLQRHLAEGWSQREWRHLAVLGHLNLQPITDTSWWSKYAYTGTVIWTRVEKFPLYITNMTCTENKVNFFHSNSLNKAVYIHGWRLWRPSKALTWCVPESTWCLVVDCLGPLPLLQ